MHQKKFPRVLIIGGPFNRINGGGITLSNLFQDWPRENLALASTSNIRINADFSICDNYFQLCYNGKLHPFPLNIVLPRVNCGPVEKLVRKTNIYHHQLSGGKYKKIYQIIYHFLIITGLYNFLYKLKVSEEFMEWINRFDPDIVYSQLGSLESIRFLSTVEELTKKPVAIHIMDDWPSIINKPSILFYYWKKKIETELRDLFLKSKLLLSISQGMSNEYRERYKRDFYPFHNPVYLDKWQKHTKESWKTNDKFRILYTGRIGVANSNSVILIAKVINGLNKRGSNYIFDIYTPDHDTRKAKLMNNMDGVYINNIVENSQVPELLSKYDLLLLPLDFDKHSVKFAKLSMPTKASEYMISGVPVLVIASDKTYLAKHAKKENWAYLLTDSNERSIAETIMQLASDMELREKLAKKAVSFAIKNEDSNLVKENFRKCLSLDS